MCISFLAKPLCTSTLHVQKEYRAASSGLQPDIDSESDHEQPAAALGAMVTGVWRWSGYDSPGLLPPRICAHMALRGLLIFFNTFGPSTLSGCGEHPSTSYSKMPVFHWAISVMMPPAAINISVIGGASQADFIAMICRL
ncbi:hypothetical protein CEXT_559791 [Caerostris extrusa]|uniref:Uncharacterized protein n=1 Tax=Caerostris extrusa TaxID=172846 RepID=A0AAV4YAP5_CAEEX|nr:hypothetical protein CEXT_559791 [Caerostris extrusa]